MTWISYAQNHEDVTLMRALGHLPQGFYIDVGAHHPTADSVTRAFYDRGWCGINIEPVPSGYRSLQAERPRDINLNLAVSDARGQCVLHEVPQTGLSTLDPQQAQAYREEGLEVRTMTVEVQPLTDICDRHAQGREIHFLKIDVEGLERAVIQGLDLRRHRPWVILVEATRPRSTEPTHHDWEPLLLSRGYQFVWFDGLNRFYVADERAALRPLLAQPPSVQDDCMRYTERFLRDDVADYAVLLAQARRRAESAEQAAQAAIAALRATHGSRSWRFTAPLRRLKAWWSGESAASQSDPSAQPQTVCAEAPQAKPRSAPTEVSSGVAPASEGLHRAQEPEISGHGHAPPPATAPAQPKLTPLAPPRRPRLAMVTPWPPAASGVADTAAMLAPALQAHFDLVVITDRDDPAADPPLRTVDWFEAHAEQFDHVVHHLGNSLFHEPVLDLLPRHGGVVVVHDFLIADLLWFLQRTARRPHAWVQALYDGHGWPALVDIRDRGIDAAVRRWPASVALLRQADGLIFTSEFSRRWWLDAIGSGPEAEGTAVVGLPLSTRPSAEPDSRLEARMRARQRLGLPNDAFIVASFGAIDLSKGHDVLAEAWRWLATQWSAQDVKAHLACIGAPADPHLAQTLQAAGAQCVGYASAQDYQDWLDAADVAVQLRRQTRGESSGALLQAMGSALPCITSRHGPMAHLPAHGVLHLAQDDAPSLAQALMQLHSQPHLRLGLGQAARAHVLEHHNPQVVAQAQARFIVQSARTGPNARRHRWVTALRAAQGESELSKAAAQAEVMARSGRAQTALQLQPPAGPPTVWIDVTAIAQGDLRSGIQRVTRNVLRPLLQQGIQGWRAEPVVLNHGRYWTSRRQTAQWLQIPAEIQDGLPADEPALMKAGDVWFGLDLVTDGVHQHEPILRDCAALGVRRVFMVHDLLPLTHPLAFPPTAVDHFTRWWGTVCRVADALVCNSATTAQSVRQWWLAHGGDIPRARPPVVDTFGLGSDLDGGGPQAQPQAVPSPPTPLPPAGGVLVVGTLEPRKAVDQALDAMDRRWAAGAAEPLVLVGRAGWMVDELVARIQSHPQRDRLLWWFSEADDALLEQLYRQSALLLMASQAEGYGLPIVEALHHGLPVLARDLPIFREIAGDAARYWNPDREALASALDQALTHPVPPSNWHPRRWADSVNALLPLLLGPGARLQNPH